MDLRFLQSVYAKGAKVCGRPLRPFSLAHRVALTALGSPFMEGAAAITPQDLVIALRVCASRTPFAPLGRPRLRDRILFWRLVLNRKAHADRCREFLDYFDEHATGPKILNTGEPSGPQDIPWVLCVVACLIRNGVPEADAWAMPEGKAVWLYVAFSRMEGADIKLWTKEHEEAAALLRKMKAEAS